MARNKWRKRFLLGLAAVVAVAILVLIIGFGYRKEKNMVTIGFIMSGSITENGWNGMHYQGVKSACDKQGVKLLIKENVAEGTGQCESALRQLAQEGAQMIFLSSYGYSEEVVKVVEEYPEIVFFVNSSEYHTDNMTSYFARMYQARYLAGIIAGMRTRSGAIGYVAAMPNNEVNRGISAFTLGVKRVNPDAKVIVAWTGTWDNKEKEQEMANRLIQEKKADVLTYHQNQAYVAEAAEAAGIDSIGYHMASKGFSEHYLTAVVCSWELVYKQMIREFLQGKGNSQNNYWIGLEQGAVGLSDYSLAVSGEIKKEVKRAKEEILSGKDIFSGEIYDRDGMLRCGKNETISDEMLLEQFDWYVEGVEFYEE